MSKPEFSHNNDNKNKLDRYRPLTMKYCSLFVALLALFGAEAFSPSKWHPMRLFVGSIFVVRILLTNTCHFSPVDHFLAHFPILDSAPKQQKFDFGKAATGAFAAFTIGSSVLTAPMNAGAMDNQPFTFSSTNVIAEKVTKQGLYGEYTVDVYEQEVDDAASTFKSAKETKSKKGKTNRHIISCVGCFTVEQNWAAAILFDDTHRGQLN